MVMSSSHEGLSITEREEKIAFIIEKRKARGIHVDEKGLRKLSDQQIIAIYYEEINYEAFKHKNKEVSIDNPDELCRAILVDNFHVASISSSRNFSSDAEKWELMEWENQQMVKWANEYFYNKLRKVIIEKKLSILDIPTTKELTTSEKRLLKDVLDKNLQMWLETFALENNDFSLRRSK